MTTNPYQPPTEVTNKARRKRFLWLLIAGMIVLATLTFVWWLSASRPSMADGITGAT